MFSFHSFQFAMVEDTKQLQWSEMRKEFAIRQGRRADEGEDMDDTHEVGVEETSSDAKKRVVRKWTPEEVCGFDGIVSCSDVRKFEYIGRAYDTIGARAWCTTLGIDWVKVEWSNGKAMPREMAQSVGSQYQ